MNQMYTITVHRREEMIDANYGIELLMDGHFAAKLWNGETRTFQTVKNKVQLQARVVDIRILSFPHIGTSRPVEVTSDKAARFVYQIEHDPENYSTICIREVEANAG